MGKTVNYSLAVFGEAKPRCDGQFDHPIGGIGVLPLGMRAKRTMMLLMMAMTPWREGLP